jgi:hypothetical protein
MLALVGTTASADTPDEHREGSRSSFQDSGKQLRVALAQYQAAQRVFRQEYFLWAGQNPSRPVVSTIPMFTVPYHHVHYPLLPYGRSLYYYGPEYRAF